MKISPMASPANSVGASPQAPTQAPRTLRMNTNATPGKADAQVENLPPAPATPPDPLANSDTSSQANASEDTKPLSPQMVALAKQRRALQVKEREIQAREEALKTQTPAQGAGIDPAKLKADPLRVMLEHGVTYQQLTDAVLQDQSGNLPELQALKAKIAELESGIDKRFSDKTTQDEQAALAEMGREATRLAAEGDAYELVRETGSVPKVTELIERVYRQEGVVLSVTEALEMVENELITDGLKMAGLKKVQSKLVPPAPVTQAPPQQPKPAMRTLTNRDTAQPPLSRKARALAAFNGTLNKGA